MELNDDPRQNGLTTSLEGLAELERHGEYAAAYEEVLRLAEEFSGLHDWEAELTRLEAAAQLDAADRQAQEAAAAGDREGAVQALLEVIARDPLYNYATGRLHALVTGVDSYALTMALEEEKNARLADSAADRVRLDACNAQLAKLRESFVMEHPTLAALETKLRAETAARAEAERQLQTAEAEVSEVRKELAQGYRHSMTAASGLRLEAEARAQAEARAAEATAGLEETSRLLVSLQAQLAASEKPAPPSLSRATGEQERKRARRARLVSGLAALAVGLAAGLTAGLAATYRQLGTTRRSLQETTVELETAKKELGSELAKARTELTSAREKLAKITDPNGPFAVEGLLQMEKVELSTSGEDATKCVVTRNDTHEFPAAKTCFVHFDLTLRNNAAGLIAPTGPLCIKYFGPDGTLATGDAPYAPPASEGPCSLGLPLNIAGTTEEPQISVGIEKEIFQAQSAWGSEDGAYYAAVPGAHRIEFWWHRKKIGETQFQIVDSKPQ
jgi:hypothetical protein